LISANELFITETLTVSENSQYLSIISHEILCSKALCGRCTTLKWKPPRAKGKCALSFEEHISVSCAPAVKFVPGRKFRRYKHRITCDSIPPIICHVGTCPQRYRALGTWVKLHILQHISFKFYIRIYVLASIYFIKQFEIKIKIC